MEKQDAPKNIYKELHESPKVMTVPLFILAIGSIFSGIIFADYFIGEKQDFFWDHVIVLSHGSHYQMPFLQTLIIKASVAIGVVLAAVIYFYREGLSKSLSRKI